jgi:hypothetical protein
MVLQTVPRHDYFLICRAMLSVDNAFMLHPPSTNEPLHPPGAGAVGGKARAAATTGAAGGKPLPTSTNSATAMAMAKAGGSGAAPAGVSVKGKAMLDLESLAFAQGSHFMSNQNCKLPDGTFTVDKKGYQEVHVPALKTADMSPSEHLVQISDLPEWSHKAFAGMKTLNRVQSRLYQTALLSAENLLLCAPTGAGKTNVAMLTILREIGLHRNEDGCASFSHLFLRHSVYLSCCRCRIPITIREQWSY